MQTICFVSSNPFDHVQRALDVLRKMDFGLKKLSVETCTDGFSVSIAFEPSGVLPPDVFIARLGQFDGLEVSPFLTPRELGVSHKQNPGLLCPIAGDRHEL